MYLFSWMGPEAHTDLKVANGLGVLGRRKDGQMVGRMRGLSFGGLADW